MSDQPIITSRIKPFLKRSGIGKTKFFELRNAGEIETAKHGNMTLVIEESYRQFLERHRVPPKNRPAE
jgi:hypothetical protein